MIKWRLMLTTLPYVVVITGLAFVRDYVLHLKGVFDLGDVSPFLTVVSLIIGFMLAGVLADYKESEKIPGEMATSLETIGDTVEVAIATNNGTDVSDFEARFHKLVCAVDDWFKRESEINRCYAALNEFNDVIARMQAASGVSYTIRAMGEVHNLRRSITRADVMERTSFIQVGYALLDMLVAGTILLLLAANYKTVAAEYLLIATLSLIYLYLDRLIRDIDQPFMYRIHKSIYASAEVNPYPLQEYRRRLEKNLKSHKALAASGNGRTAEHLAEKSPLPQSPQADEKMPTDQP